jgi:hypothetical protein
MTDFQIILCTCADREQAVPVSGGSESYLAWLDASLR